MGFIEQLPDLIIAYGLKILGAILIILIGRWLAGLLARTAEKVSRRTQTSEALIRFVRSLIYWGISIPYPQQDLHLFQANAN